MLKKIGFRRVGMICIDILTLSVSCMLGVYLMRYLPLVSLTGVRVTVMSTIFIFSSIIALFLTGVYRTIWVYSNSFDFLGCIAGLSLGTVVAIAIGVLIQNMGWAVRTPNSLMIVFLAVSCVLMTITRKLFSKAFSIIDTHSSEKAKFRTLIIGAGEAGQEVAHEMLNNSDCEYAPVCFVDDDNDKKFKRFQKIQVLGTTNDIGRLCKDLEVDTIMFAIPSCKSEDRRRILDICNKTECRVKIIPFIQEILFKDNYLRQAQNINIEDLLGRETITFDNEGIRGIITNKVCMVTGGGGSIGSELCRQIAKYNPKELIILDIYENNVYDIEQQLLMEYGGNLKLTSLICSVRDYNKLSLVFDKYRPDTVFHAAAHKHVPLMETSPEEAVKNNVIGTFNAATLAEFHECERFVLVSTDKAVNPTNVMGATKRCCEMIVQYMAQQNPKTDFVTVRFGNVLGSNGSVIPLFRRQIETNHPVTVTHPDIIRYFMTIPEAVSLILEAGSIAKGGEIFVLDMGEPVKIVTLAENLIRQYGKTPYKDVEIKFTGLRPGEKLYEELLMSEEGLQSTCNHKIFIGNQIEINDEDFLNKLVMLKAAALQNDSKNTVKMLHEIVPTFHPENVGKRAADIAEDNVNSKASERKDAVMADIVHA